MLNLKVTLIVLFFPYLLLAQHPNWDSETITVKDGLRSDGVTAILKDRQGFMWFATKMGLHRFDGYQLKTYKYNVTGSVSLSENKILDLYEDQNGSLWMAMNRGVNKLNPNMDQIVHFIPDPNDPKSISDGEIKRIFVDSQGTIWAGTTYGLDRLNSDHKSFTHYTHNPNDSTSLSGNFVTSIYEDKENTLWIGTAPGGLNKMERISGTFQRFTIDPMDSRSLSNSVNCIYEDKSGNFWIGTFDGLYHFNRKDSSFSRILQKDQNPNAPKSQIFAAVFEDFEGNYWIRTYSGLYQYDSQMKQIDAREHRTLNPVWGVWENIKSIYQDSSGTLWYSKHYKGIEKLIPKNRNFRFYRNNPNIESTSVRSFYIENKEIIWMGTNAGLSRMDRRKNEYQLFKHNQKDPNSISSNVITGIFRDQKGTLWIGTYDGLNRLELLKDNNYKFIHYKHNLDDPASIANNFVSRIFEDQSGRLFFILNDYIIDIFDHENDEFLHLEYHADNQKIDQIGAISLIETDRIWTSNRRTGLSEIILPLRRRNKYTLTPDTIIYYNSKPGSINVNSHMCIYKDHFGTYWIGTEGGGLNKMTLNTNTETNEKEIQFEYYTRKNGLCNDDISAILEDKKGHLWLGTQNGLSRFDPKTENFTNYDKSDGILNISFGSDAYQAPDGEMFFNSDNGLLTFYPDSIKDNPIMPTVVITDLKIFNKSVSVGAKSPLQTSISSATEITLPYNQNFLSFEFAALNYLHPEKNQYKYKMEGLDADWIEAGTRRHADYPDLRPGDYTFKAIGSNNSGLWNMEGTSLHISILPPWWATYYAYTTYVFLAIMLMFGYVRLRIWQVKKQKNMLEKEVKVRTQQIIVHQEEIESQKELLEKRNQKIVEMDKMKTKFFNNISHEFRTPLTLIQGPVEDLITDARVTKKEHGKLRMISQNAARLLILVNQLLDIAKLDSGHKKLKLVNGDILHSLRIIAGSFSPMAETRGILYNRTIPMGKYNTWFDYSILEKIVTNLLSNAFKFTPEAGAVTFRASWFHGETTDSPDQLEFSVTDQGPGIPVDSMDKIFTRFYQVEGEDHQSASGTGIGLSLVRDLVKLNHGEIKVESEPGKGSMFTVRLPLGKDYLTESEYIISSKKEEIPKIISNRKKEVAHTTTSTKELINQLNNDEKPIVLVVDDNADIRSHINENLESSYKIIEAVNGRAGLKKAQEIIPNLMITDLIMPTMDGIELCRQMKIDERTSHIPIIMLTAKTSMEEKLEGLEIGADDYISKPFHMKELITRIANLIEQRKKLRERFNKEITLEPCEISITSVDERFLTRAIQTIEKHLHDEKFDISKFQKAMHMSRSTLFRKLQALTNLSPTGFIRNIRLKRAAQLLKEHYGNIAEISYEVGFSNPAYFSKCFKSLFGMSPVDYIKSTASQD